MEIYFVGVQYEDFRSAKCIWRVLIGKHLQIDSVMFSTHGELRILVWNLLFLHE